MPRNQPYKVDRLTGKSVTREYVERFLERAFNVSDDGPPIIERLYTNTDSLIQLRENIYTPKSEDSLKRYIGRAAHVTSGHNPHEETWCIKIDIATACKKLDERTRRILGQKYVRGYDDQTIAEQFDLTDRAVRYIVSNALTRIAKILDRET